MSCVYGNIFTENSTNKADIRIWSKITHHLQAIKKRVFLTEDHDRYSGAQLQIFIKF